MKLPATTADGGAGRRRRRHLLVGLVFVVALALVLVAGQPTGALPEYSEQTGEPCAGCHISPSGGGLRTPRGQAWVGSGRPGVVPNLTDSLALLGVRLTVDEADFVALSDEVRLPPEAPEVPSEPAVIPAQAEELRSWLRTYAGN